MSRTIARCVLAYDRVPTHGVKVVAIALQRLDPMTFSPPETITWEFFEDTELVFNGVLIMLDQGCWFVPILNGARTRVIPQRRVTFILGPDVQLRMPTLH